MNSKELYEAILEIPEGYSEVYYCNKKYGITKSIFNQQKSCKIYAEELGGTDFISFNYYQLSSRPLLKPCEMLESKVIKFLENTFCSNR